MGSEKLMQNGETNLTRRLFLAASAGFLMQPYTWAESRSNPVLCWKLEESGDAAREVISGKEDAIPSRTGHAAWVGKGSDRALRLDGYSVWIKHTASPLLLRDAGVTICGWLALESYPVDAAAIVQLDGQSSDTIRLSIDRWGYLEFSGKTAETLIITKSNKPIPTRVWTHVAASSGKDGTTLFMNGVPCGAALSSNGSAQPMQIASVTIGRSGDCPLIAEVFPTGVLNDLIKDLRVFDEQLTRGSIVDILGEAKPIALPDLEINRSWCAEDSQRPIYHALPPRAWTNEPHGLIHWGDQYHLFYQKNANGPYWGHINWGHMTSPDLYRWTEMPVALSPEPGPDAEGCWSGSVIEHKGKLALIYTGGDGRRSSICLATSSDGVNFTKHPGNPIIAQPPQGQNYPEFRDPHVWREGDTYYLLIGSAVKDVGGKALLYRSTDLLSWEFRKPLMVGNRETSGVFWEMRSF